MKSNLSFVRVIFFTAFMIVLGLDRSLAELTEDQTKKVEELKQEAKQAMEEGRWDDFEILIKKMIEIDKDDPQNYRRLGQALFNREEYIEAEPILEKALELGDISAIAGLALTKLRLGKDDWVKQREVILLRQIENGDIDCLSPLALWSIKKKDLQIFQKAMEHVDDQELSRSSMVAYACLGAYRFHLKEIERKEAKGE